MSADAILAAALRRARRRRLLDALWLGLPPIAAAVAVAMRLGYAAIAIIVAVLGAAALAAFAWHRVRSIDTRWLARRLDAQRTDMNDSAGLLFMQDAALSPLQRLQRARLQARIAAGPMPSLGPRYSTRSIAAACVLACLVIATAVLWPAREPLTVANVIAKMGTGPARPTHTRVVAQELHIAPPAYTGRAPVRQSALSARAPERSTLRWMLRFAPQPRAAALVFHDGRRVALARQGEDWQAREVVVRSALYRIELDGAPPLRSPQRYRLDVIADRAPQVRVVTPERSLSLATVGQRHWAVAFEAQDDYGVAPAAQLRVILAQGSGENITFRERSVALRGSGPATRRRFSHRLDLRALGFAAGDDLVVQLAVRDTRAPVPHRARSASAILRWPPDLGQEATGLEGMVRKTLPAYFRSQRQIILDAEALLKQKRRLDADTYVQRSDAIGVDQRLLRLRYGQFLGEEAQGAPSLPTNDAADAPPLPTNDAEPVDDPAGDEHDEGHADAATGHDGHDDHGAPTTQPVFGEEGAVLEQFGHTHDESEAATLLDPETRTTLKAALDQMWQSELHLRQGAPERALPYAYKALGFIKQVQQASRIYLARVGPELPPIDPTRRLGGDRTGLSRRDDVLVAGATGEPALAALWQALDETAQPPQRARRLDTAALERWLRDNPTRVADPLAFVAALDAVRADPACARCRRDLRALLWPLLPRPATAVPRRNDGGPAGPRYLDALRRGEPR